jgi:hypothetical protein
MAMSRKKSGWEVDMNWKIIGGREVAMKRKRREYELY